MNTRTSTTHNMLQMANCTRLFLKTCSVICELHIHEHTVVGIHVHCTCTCNFLSIFRFAKLYTILKCMITFSAVLCCSMKKLSLDKNLPNLLHLFWGKCTCTCWLLGNTPACDFANFVVSIFMCIWMSCTLYTCMKHPFIVS